MKVIDDVRHDGFSIDDGESEDGVRCVGVASAILENWPITGFSISGPLTRITNERTEQMADALRTASDAFTALLQ